MDHQISTVAVSEYALDVLEQAVQRHFSALGIQDRLHSASKVVLKPNLLKGSNPASAITTHPTVVEAVIRVLQGYGVTAITIADSPGGPYTEAALQSIYAASGMRQVAERTGVTLNTDVGWQEVQCQEAVLCRRFSVIQPIAEADIVINLVKLKTHAMTTLSGGVKNLFGVVPGLKKPELHFRFPEKAQFCRMLVDLSLLVKPTLTLVDAVVSMEGDGPAGGDPRHTGMTFAARNVYALDLALCSFIALDPGAVGTVTHAIADGLCPPAAEELVWLEEGAPQPIADFRHPKSKPLSFLHVVPPVLRRPLEWMEQTFFTPRPAIVAEKCIGCGKCAESCAPRAIVIQNKKAILTDETCIRCFCCHEMCPVEAMRIRRNRLL